MTIEDDKAEAISIMRELPDDFLREVIELILELEKVDPNCTESEFCEYLSLRVTQTSKPH